MTAIQHKTRKKWPDIFNGYEVRLTPLRETLEGEFRPAVLILTATAGCLLLLTCASLANLLIARSAAHEREMAVRTALGASRFDLAIRVLLSNLILALAGSALGWALCRAAIIAIVHLEPVLGGLKGIEVDSLANFALCLVLSLATALLVSVPIILGLSHTTIHNSLKDGGRGGTSGLRRQRIRGLLVSAEVALAVSLLVVSGLLARSFVGLMSTDLGFKPDNVLLLESNIGDSYYNTNAKRLGYYRPLLQALQGVPGVVSIGGMRYFPMHARLWTIGIGIKENPASNAQQPIVYWNRVAGDYFNAMRIPLIAGRLPSANEMWGDSENVLINVTAAQAFFRNADEAVGKHIQLGMQGHEVIGVVGSVRQAGLGRRPVRRSTRSSEQMNRPESLLLRFARARDRIAPQSSRSPRSSSTMTTPKRGLL